MAEMVHSIFVQKIKCNFLSTINHNLQPHKSTMRNINFCWINYDVFSISLQTVVLFQIEYFHPLLPDTAKCSNAYATHFLQKC